jgi:2-succinyl-5-enolpyruvyl-6-hydroxy-3-cyclohexene-1-carboxylate synthase
MMAALGRLSGLVLPWWAKWAALAALVLAAYGVGRLQEAHRGADAMVAYVGQQAAQSARIVVRQAKVVTVVETKYVDRIQKIYVEGKQIEADIPQYITPADAGLFAVNAGFVRVVDAAWSGEPAGPAADSDRGPAGIPLDRIAAVEAGNATSCRAWREQALGWRDFYAGQQVAINGRAGEWAQRLGQ